MCYIINKVEKDYLRERMREMESRHKNILIGILLAIVFVMSIGYAAFTQSLNITGTASLDAKWDVHMTENNGSGVTSSVDTDLEMNVITSDGQSTTGTINVAEGGLTATVSATLVTPGDTVTFRIPIVNEGTINAQLNSLLLSEVDDNDDFEEFRYSTTNGNTATATSNSGNLRFTVTAPSTSDILSAGGYTYITIVAEYIDIDIEDGGNENAYGETASLTITMNYVQES